jgi:hypothetical protein
MASAWPNIRYWIALLGAVLLAVLAVSSFGMGGPSGAVGWFFFALSLGAPPAIWWTRRGRAAPYLQHLLFALALLLVAYLTVVAHFS